MSLKINTNIAALNAHRNMIKNDNGLSKSLERLSSGLRINKAADDASGMAIADSLKAQSLGLGQAVANANDAVSVVQIADGALEESINIVNSIRTKAIQAASDGQSSASRAAIQRDINKLLGAMNNIANTTAFNGQNLLDGAFTGKSFQVGAYANQTISVSISGAKNTQVGKLANDTTTAFVNDVVNADIDTSASDNVTRLADNSLAINGVSLNGLMSGSDQLSAKALAQAINATSGATGASATATNEQTATGGAVTGGEIADGDFMINGVNIGAISVQDWDANGALVMAINEKSTDTGVEASTNTSGELVLTADDGRNIAVTANTNVTNITGFSQSVSSVGLTNADAVLGDADTLYIGGTAINFSAAGTTTTEGTAGMISAALDSSQYSVSVNGDVITVTRLDGQDINIKDNVADTDLSLTAVNGGALDTDLTLASDFSGIYNGALQGEVSLTSTTSITESGDATVLAGYGLSETSIAASGGIADANVTTESAAQITIQRADSALSKLDEIRSGIGSAQNQIESTIRNISITQVNITSAESGIRDVDFAAESASFAKFQVLAQSGSFAMAQSNASLQNVLRLLQ